MNNETITKEYINFLKSLERKNSLILDFSKLESYKERENFLNKYSNDDLINIFQREDFKVLFSIPRQAEYLIKCFPFSSLENLKTLIYCYNTNSREFKNNLEGERLKEELIKEGFKEQGVLNIEELKHLNGLKVYCVFDKNKIGLLGSFTKKEKHEGTFKFIEHKNILAFLPKGHSKTGQFLINKFYYKLK